MTVRALVDALMRLPLNDLNEEVCVRGLPFGQIVRVHGVVHSDHVYLEAESQAFPVGWGLNEKVKAAEELFFAGIEEMRASERERTNGAGSPSAVEESANTKGKH